LGGNAVDVKHDVGNNKLTSGEVSELLSSYMSNSASVCVLSYFAEKVQDPDASVVIKLALHLSQKAVAQIKDMFKSANHPIPIGFSDTDVNINAKKLYSDTFMLLYVSLMARFGLTNYSEARASSSNPDVREFLNRSIHATMELFNLADDILLSKGLYTKPPYIPIPESIDFVKKQGFLHGLLGEKRPLNVTEIDRLYLNFRRNSIGKALVMGFSQTTSNKDIQEFLMRGVGISANHMEVITSLLRKDNLPIPMILDTEVLDSTEPVFSDRLMVLHVTALDALGLATNGITLSRVMRHDLTLAITRFMAEIAQYAKEGMDIMIDNEWLQRIPEAANREELIGV
jgi:hypothetical protein